MRERHGISCIAMNLHARRVLLRLAGRRALEYALFFAWGAGSSLRADMTWVYAVQINATVETNPPQIHLSWRRDELGADSYAVQRKLKTDTAWGAATSLPGSATNY